MTHTTSQTLYVDLDGTLVKTDTLVESLLRLIKLKPIFILKIPFWLLKGKAQFKQQVASHISIDPATLPYHEEFVEFLKYESAKGTKLVLATAAHGSIAQAVADHTGLFDDVCSTEGETNLAGQSKLDAIKKQTPEFSYAGNAKPDLAIWKEAKSAIVVGSKSIRDRASQVTEISKWFAPDRTMLKVIVKGMRVHQWAKNMLMFLPLILAHEWYHLEKVTLGLWGFLSFCLVASSVYLINDLMDLESDRLHPEKKKRPLASGDMSLPMGMGLAAIFMVAGLTIAAIVSTTLLLALIVYYVVTTLYTFKLKRIPIVDAVTLAGLYSWRIITGGRLTEVPITFWLIAFGMFFFLSLAFAKRSTELLALRNLDKENVSGRGYRAQDFDMVRLLGVCSGIASVVVLTMYMNNPEIQRLYETPSYLLGAAIAILYWICRVWLLTDRGEMNSDPIVFAIKDKASYAVLLLVGLFGVLARFF